MGKFLGYLVIFLGILAFAFGLSIIFAWPVMLLWNWLMPVIFGLPPLTFWQSFGLMLLCSLLFKSTSTSDSK